MRMDTIIKKFVVLFLSIVTTSFLSCTKKLGDWDPIKLSKSEITFCDDGGTYTVESLNYKGWWINGIQDMGTEVYYSPDDTDRNMVTGEGISAKTEGNSVIITVEPSSDKHDWSVHMEAGDAFAYIRVTQN